jgi:hypothetical protein
LPRRVWDQHGVESLMSKPLHRFTLFCTVCKEHVEIHAEDGKTAQGKFEAHGHQSIKVRHLRPGNPRNGVPGVTKEEYKRPWQRALAHEAERKKKRGSKVVQMQEERAVEEAHGA